MKCPYCDNKMESGNLSTEGGPGLFYMPDGQKYNILMSLRKQQVESKGGVVLDGPYKTRFHRTRIGCYACKHCRKIIVSY